jgi:FAD/FMN-containing dehydrogenase
MNLKNLLKEFDFSTDDNVLEEYSQDKSIFKIKPKVIIFPKNSEEIKKIIKIAKDNDFSLTARAAGTDMSGGPLTDSVLLVFTKYLNKILEINPQEKYVILQPGVYFRDLEKELDKYNLMFPSYPASKELCAIGGMVANNSGGEKTLKYGKTHNYVIGLKVVLSDGEEYYLESQDNLKLRQDLQNYSEDKKNSIDKKNNIHSDSFASVLSSNNSVSVKYNSVLRFKNTEFYQKTFQILKENYELIQKTRPQVSKNSSGYNIWDAFNGNALDLVKLFVGSQGTLGIITEIKIKLVDKEKFSQLLVIFIKNLKDLPHFTQDILKLQPASLEITDDHTFKIFLKFAREMASLLGSKGIFEMIKLFFPEMVILFKIGFPKLIVLAEFIGNNKEEIDGKINQAKKISQKYRYLYRQPKDEKEAGKYWRLRRDTYRLLREKIKNLTAAPFIDDFIILPEYLPEFLPKLYKILDAYSLTYTISGHLGDGNLHIIPLVNLKDEKQRKNILEITDKVYDLVLKYNGILTAEHNDGLIRGPYLEKEFGKEIYNIFKEIKNIFDPYNIFNPYKKITAQKEYLEKFMIR